MSRIIPRPVEPKPVKAKKRPRQRMRQVSAKRAAARIAALLNKAEGMRDE